MEVHRRLLEILMIANPARIDPLAIYLQASNVGKARFRSRPFARTDEIRRNLPDVRVPVRAIWGADDSTALPSIEARYGALREGHPELVTHTVPDAGHWVMYEQPDAYVDSPHAQCWRHMDKTSPAVGTGRRTRPRVGHRLTSPTGVILALVARTHRSANPEVSCVTPALAKPSTKVATCCTLGSSDQVRR